MYLLSRQSRNAGKFIYKMFCRRSSTEDRDNPMSGILGHRKPVTGRASVSTITHDWRNSQPRSQQHSLILSSILLFLAASCSYGDHCMLSIQSCDWGDPAPAVVACLGSEKELLGGWKPLCAVCRNFFPAVVYAGKHSGDRRKKP